MLFTCILHKGQFLSALRFLRLVSMRSKLIEPRQRICIPNLFKGGFKPCDRFGGYLIEVRRCLQVVTAHFNFDEQIDSSLSHRSTDINNQRDDRLAVY